MQTTHEMDAGESCPTETEAGATCDRDAASPVPASAPWTEAYERAEDWKERLDEQVSPSFELRQLLSWWERADGRRGVGLTAHDLVWDWTNTISSCASQIEDEIRPCRREALWSAATMHARVVADVEAFVALAARRGLLVPVDPAGAAARSGSFRAPADGTHPLPFSIDRQTDLDEHIAAMQPADAVDEIALSFCRATPSDPTAVDAVNATASAPSLASYDLSALLRLPRLRRLSIEARGSALSEPTRVRMSSEILGRLCGGLDCPWWAIIDVASAGADGDKGAAGQRGAERADDVRAPTGVSEPHDETRATAATIEATTQSELSAALASLDPSDTTELDLVLSRAMPTDVPVKGQPLGAFFDLSGISGLTALRRLGIRGSTERALVRVPAESVNALHTLDVRCCFLRFAASSVPARWWFW